MKYIILKKIGNSFDIYHPIIFPNHLTHADMAEALLQANFELREFKVDSAGDFNIMSGECSGKSSTLGIESQPTRDTRIIRMNDYGGGMF